MLILIAFWALAEATIFFIVADVPIMALGLHAGRRKAMIGAVIAAICAAIGGTGIAFWAGLWPKDVIELVLATPAIDAELLAQVWEDWQARGAIGMLIGSFSGVPYKLYALAAGSAGGLTLGWIAWFFFASILARLPRFMLVALIAGWIGPRLKERLGLRAVWFLFALGWTLFYAWYWSVTGF